MAAAKILHIITRLAQGGSSENVLYSMVGLKKKGFELYLVSGLIEDPGELIRQYIEENTINFTCIPELVRQVDPWKDIKAFFNIYFFIKKYNFDIVHTHTSKAGILGRWAAWFAGVPVRIHTPHGHVFYGYYGKITSCLFAVIEKSTSYITSRIIALTQGEIDDHITYRIAKRNKFTVIPSGINIEKYQHAKVDPQKIRLSLGIDKDCDIVGDITRLEPIKGARYAVRAWKKVVSQKPDAQLLIIGDGSERKMLEKLAGDLGIRRSIMFTRFRHDLPRLISIMNFLILPSLNEGMGKVLIQAAAMGKPSIGSRVCGIPDVIDDNRTGLLVPRADPEKLADAILYLLDNPEKVISMGKNAYRRVTELIDGYPRFSEELMVNKIYLLYQELLH